MEGQTKISFHFHPYKQEENLFAVEKGDSGKKRRYLRGISSGIQIDGHGERMTPNCVKSFMEQSNSGDVLLYPDVHGIRSSEDIGRLVKANVSPVGDWETEFRLHDESDGVGPVKLEKISDIWKQMTGMPPYSKPKQRGFSIEGYIPPEGIKSLTDGGKRVIDNVLLDGVVLVPRPAYKDSIANAIYKALGELSPWEYGKVKADFESSLVKVLKSGDMKGKYFSTKYEIEDTMTSLVEKVMADTKPYKKERLETLFEEYKGMMVDLIVKSGDIFTSEDEADKNLQEVNLSTNKIKILKEIESNFQRLIPIMKRSKTHGKR